MAVTPSLRNPESSLQVLHMSRDGVPFPSGNPYSEGQVSAAGGRLAVLCSMIRAHPGALFYILGFKDSLHLRGLPSWRLVVKNPPANAGDIGDVGSICGSGRSPGGVHANPLQYSCLENPLDRGAWRATVHRVTKSRTPLK